MLTNSISWATRQTAMQSDQDPGGAGVSTGNKTMAGSIAADAGDISGLAVAPQMEGKAVGHPVIWWAAIGVILVAIKYLSEAGGNEKEFGNVKIGFFNLLVISLSAIVGLIFLKWVFGMYRIPGLSEIVLAA